MKDYNKKVLEDRIDWEY